ncbi:MAG: hypothetical protein IH991_18870 [Planctomycetes bacterium]|nr:hypothetical protein [Planctomycetota bacterium]
MPQDVVDTIYDEDRKRRVQVFQRDDGTFGYCEEHFSDYPNEDCWIPRRQQIESFCDTLETVMREVHGRVEWVSKTGSSG